MRSQSGRSSVSLPVLITLGIAGLWVVMALLTWGGLQNGVRLSSPFSTFGYGQAALFSSSVNLVHVAAVLVWTGMTALIGYYFVIRRIWGGKGLAGPLWMGFSGLIPGMFLIGAVTRLVTFALPNQPSSWLVAGLLLTTSGYAAWRLRQQAHATPRAPSVWRHALLAGAAVAAALVFQIHMDKSHAVAEGSIWFINEIFLSPEYGIGADGHFPLIAQHYDEAAYLHALIYLMVAPGAEASGSLTVIYWMMLAISRVGMVALTYIALRGLRLDQLSAAACTAFVCMASLSLNPFSSRLLFDSLSPMIYTLHMARFLAPVLPLLIISALAQGRARLTAPTLITGFLLGIGLAATPVHFVTLALWAGVIVLVYAFLKRGHTVQRTSALWAVIAVLTTVSLAYALKDVSAYLGVGLLGLGSFVGGLAILWWIWKAGLRLPSWQSEAFAVFGVFVITMAGYGLAMILLGNVAVPILEPYLENTLWSGRDTIVRLGGAIVLPETAIRVSPYCDTGSFWAFRTLTGHCESLPLFVRTYGLPFVLIATALSLRALIPAPTVSQKTGLLDDLTAWGLILCLLALPLSFVLFDFVTPDGSDSLHAWAIWLRSRLVEPWFIGGVLLALAYMLRVLDDRSRNWLIWGLLFTAIIHTLNPLIASGQWMANIAYLINAMMT